MMLRVIDCFAESLTVTQNGTIQKLVFYSLFIATLAVLRYSASENGVMLKYGLGVVQSHRKWRCSIDCVQLSVGRPL